MSTSEAADAAGAREERAQADADLLKRVARDDREAFAELYDRLARPLYATALQITGNATETEDIVQAVFLSLWERAGEFEPERQSVFEAAVMETRRRAVERVRTRPRRPDTASPLPATADAKSAGSDSVAKLLAKEHAQALRAGMAALTPDERATVETAFFGAFTPTELAARLGQPIAIVRERLRFALLKLRDPAGAHHG